MKTSESLLFIVSGILSKKKLTSVLEAFYRISGIGFDNTGYGTTGRLCFVSGFFFPAPGANFSYGSTESSGGCVGAA